MIALEKGDGKINLFTYKKNFEKVIYGNAFRTTQNVL
jgi:hypothetical protein